MWFKCWVYLLTKLRMRKRHLLIGIIACLILTLYLYSSPSKSQTIDQSNNVNKNDPPGNRLQEATPFYIGDQRNRNEIHKPNKFDSDDSVKLNIVKLSDKKEKTNSLNSQSSSISLLKHSVVSQLTLIEKNDTQFYEYPLKVVMDEVIAILRNQLTFQALEESVDKTRSYLVDHQPEFDVNSGACECNRISDPCICCATITAKQCKIIQGKTCLNFTYLPVKQALLVNMTIDQHLLFESLINIKTPPQLCAGSKNSSGGVYVCSHLRYLSYGVEMQEEHKTRFSGCADILVKLNGRDIAILPLGCFKAPKSDSKNVFHDKIPAVLN